MSKPVKITLDGKIVYECDTILEAEEWLVDDPDTDKDRVAAGDYHIDAPESLMQAYVNSGTDTDVPEEQPLNDVAMLRAALVTMRSAVVDYEDDPDLDKAKELADQVLDRVTPSEAHPWVKVFDEVVSAGRSELLAFIDEGGQAEEITPMDDILKFDPIGHLTKDAVLTAPPLNRPMRSSDVVRLLRNRGGKIVHALGVAPLYFAVPGMRHLLRDLDDATKVPCIEDYDTEAVSVMAPHMVSYDEWDGGRRTVSRSDVERAASQRSQDQEVD